MNRTSGFVVIAALLLGVGVGYALRRPAPASHDTSSSHEAAAHELEVLYWYDPMRPDQHFDKPGKSPFMDMQLVPKLADGDSERRVGGVSVDARTAQNLGVRTAVAERAAHAPEITVAGTIAYDDTALDVVQARARGYLERVYVREPLARVRRGQALAELVAPEWSAAQAEYQALRELSGPAIAGLRAAARQRLVVLGMPQETIRRLDRGDAALPRVTLVAPRDGVIAELDAREGQAVEPGMPLFRINGLASVWVHAEVPEAQSATVREGLRVSLSVPAYPDRVFAGIVNAVLPQVDPLTRTLRVRIELPNPDGALAPGMFADVRIHAAAGEAQLWVPSEAVIRTGTRTVVIVAEAQGRFRPLDVQAGAEADGKTAILDGLDDGARVVVSGQFLIDSEASLRGSLLRMSEPPEHQP